MTLFLRLLLVVVAVLTASLTTAQEATPQQQPAVLPSEWLGTWKGQVKAETPDGKSSTFDMELEIGELPDRQRLKWKIVYDGSQGKSVRDYEIVAEDVAAGRLVIDERNGVRIATSRLGNSLHSHFSIDGQTLWARYELVNTESTILFEVVTAPEQPALTTRVENQEVKSLLPASRQTARLKRSTPSQAGAASDDGRTVWEKLKTEPYRGKQDDIYFVNERVGWYVNGAGRIYKTNDGGDSWTKQLDQPGTYFRCLALVDESHGFAGNIGPGYFPNVSDKNPLYETKDGGSTWQPVTTIEGQPVVGLCALQVLREEFINAGKLDYRTRLIGVGRVGGPVSMIVSDDVGASWQQLAVPKQAAMAFDVHFFNRSEGFLAAASDADVANSHALILYTQDGGASWKEVYKSTRPYELTWKIAFPTQKVGYVTIQSYNPDPQAAERFVAKTIDGGATWREVPLVSNPAVREFGIAFLNETTGWVGAMPHGFFTADGGQSWQKADMGNAVNKIRLVPSVKKTLGFAIGTEVRRVEIKE